MTAHELLSQLRAKGVELKTSGGDRLVIDAPKGTVTEELRSALSAHKAELLQILKAEENAPAAAPEISEVAAEPGSEWTTPPIEEAPMSSPAIESQSDRVAASTVEEITQLQEELMRLRTEEEARRAEIEAERLAAEHGAHLGQERLRQGEEEIARRRAEHERQRIEAEARERAEEEQRRRIADEEITRAAEKLAQMHAAEEARRSKVDAHVRAAIEAHEAELAALRQAEEAQARTRAEEERRHLESEARRRAQEEELRRHAESRFRAVEEEIERVQARELARIRAAQEAQRLAEEAERRRAEEETRRQAEERARLRAEEEARLRAEIEGQLRAEAEERRRVEEEARREAEEEARRRAEEEAQLLAAERARRLAEEEAQRRADEEARRQAEDAARLRAEEEARLQAAEQARLRAEQEERERAESEARERTELEARIRAEIEAKIRAEETERREGEEAHRRAEHERIVAEEAAKAAAAKPQYPFEIERSEIEDPPSPTDDLNPKVTEIAEWFEADLENRKEIVPVTPLPEVDFMDVRDDEGSEFRAVSVPEENFEAAHLPSAVSGQLSSRNAAERAAAVVNLPHIGGEDAFCHISAAFDDHAVEVRNAAARALFDLQEDRAAAFTRALREASPDRRRKIGAAIASSGLANEAIRNLTGESRDKTYDAFSLLFLMSKAGEVQSLMRAIEEHPNIEVRLAVVKLLALSGQPDILPSFRRMAVRGSLPPEVRSAVMEAIYQITSQSPAESTM
jgi:hypothetical protein